jgi:hypothetical protein
VCIRSRLLASINTELHPLTTRPTPHAIDHHRSVIGPKVSARRFASAGNPFAFTVTELQDSVNHLKTHVTRVESTLSPVAKHVRRIKPSVTELEARVMCFAFTVTGLAETVICLQNHGKRPKIAVRGKCATQEFGE